MLPNRLCWASGSPKRCSKALGLVSFVLAWARNRLGPDAIDAHAEMRTRYVPLISKEASVVPNSSSSSLVEIPWQQQCTWICSDGPFLDAAWPFVDGAEMLLQSEPWHYVR